MANFVAPTFDGSAIFGPTPVILPSNNPLQRQWSQFPGVNNRQTVSGGSQGAKAKGKIVLAGDTMADLYAAIAAVAYYQADGGAYRYTDEFGNYWDGMVLVEFEPASEIMNDNSGVSQVFEIELQSTM